MSKIMGSTLLQIDCTDTNISETVCPRALKRNFLDKNDVKKMPQSTFKWPVYR